MEKNIKFPQEIKIELPYHAAITSGHICKGKNYLRDICTPIFIANLFTIAKVQKKSKCPSTDKRIK